MRKRISIILLLAVVFNMFATNVFDINSFAANTTISSISKEQKIDFIGVSPGGQIRVSDNGVFIKGLEFITKGNEIKSTFLNSGKHKIIVYYNGKIIKDVIVNVSTISSKPLTPIKVAHKEKAELIIQTGVPGLAPVVNGVPMSEISQGLYSFANLEVGQSINVTYLDDPKGELTAPPSETIAINSTKVSLLREYTSRSQEEKVADFAEIRIQDFLAQNGLSGIEDAVKTLGSIDLFSPDYKMGFEKALNSQMKKTESNSYTNIKILKDNSIFKKEIEALVKEKLSSTYYYQIHQTVNITDEDRAWKEKNLVNIIKNLQDSGFVTDTVKNTVELTVEDIAVNPKGLNPSRSVIIDVIQKDKQKYTETKIKMENNDRGNVVITSFVDNALYHLRTDKRYEIEFYNLAYLNEEDGESYDAGDMVYRSMDGEEIKYSTVLKMSTGFHYLND